MFYMYAVVEGLPAAWRPPSALTPTATVERHPLGSLLVLGSTLDAVPAANPKTLALHHDVVASALDALAVLPFRYGTRRSESSCGPPSTAAHRDSLKGIGEGH